LTLAKWIIPTGIIKGCHMDCSVVRNLTMISEVSKGIYCQTNTSLICSLNAEIILLDCLPAAML